MYIDEINLHQNRPDEPPPGLGVTFVARSKTLDAPALLNQVKSIWKVVASWGREIEEQDLEDSANQELELDEDVQPLPDWFKTKFNERYHGDTLRWENDLYFRE